MGDRTVIGFHSIGSGASINRPPARVIDTHAYLHWGAKANAIISTATADHGSDCHRSHDGSIMDAIIELSKATYALASSCNDMSPIVIAPLHTTLNNVMGGISSHPHDYGGEHRFGGLPCPNRLDILRVSVTL